MIFVLILGVLLLIAGVVLAVNEYEAFAERNETDAWLLAELVTFFSGNPAVYVSLGGVLLIVIAIVKL